MRALSIRQPWAWLILNAGKNVENRVWWTAVRGRFLIHASKAIDRDVYDFREFRATVEAWAGGRRLPPIGDLLTGGVVGAATLIDVHEPITRGFRAPRVTTPEILSPWWMHDQHAFVLRDPQSLPFLAYSGRQRWFDIPDDLVAGILKPSPAGDTSRGQHP